VRWGGPTDLYKYSPDAVPPIHAESYHVATDKPPPKMATSSGLFLATVYNESHLAERKHVARFWLINTVATAVPLSAHPSPLVITTKLAAAILGGGCSEEVLCRPSTVSVGGPDWIEA